VNQGLGLKREKVSFPARRRCGPVAGAACAGETRQHSNPPRVFARNTGHKKPGLRLNSFSYLPMSLTALFVLAASLLIGLM
jgi:hypothetical protein